jgi:hypothetical protein
MRNSSGSPPDNPTDDSFSSRTSLLRAAADNELSPAESIELDSHLRALPDDQRVIDFERRLRTEIAAASPHCGQAPDALRRRLEAMTTVAPGLPYPSRRFAFRPAWAFIAASVVLVATGYLVVSRFPAQLPTQGEIVNASHRAALTRFLAWQHTDCEVHADAIKSRFDIGPAEAAPAQLARIIQREPDLGTLRTAAPANSDIEYLGAARCAVPGRGDSVHIVLGYRNPLDPSQSRLASLFVQEDNNELSLVPGRTYHMRQRPGDWDGRQITVCVWRNNGLIYFLVATSPEVLDAARISLNAEPATADL